MIEMGMGEEKRVDGRNVEAERLRIRLFRLHATLKHAAVDQHILPVELNLVAGSGDLSRSTMTTIDDFEGHASPPGNDSLGFEGSDWVFLRLVGDDEG